VTLEAYNQAWPRPELDTPSYQVLENDISPHRQELPGQKPSENSYPGGQKPLVPAELGFKG